VVSAEAADRVERILVTGGMGFIGAHTLRAVVDLGYRCIATSHRTVGWPAPFEEELGRRVVVERVDLAERSSVLALGDRHRITGIVHLADPALTHLADPDLAPATLIDDQRRGAGALLNLLEAASAWGARRVAVASTIGVYGGPGDMRGLREDAPFPTSAGGNPVGAWKRTVELLSGSVAERVGVELVIARLPAVWGPLGRNSSRFFAAPGLINAAVVPARADTLAGSDAAQPVYADEAIDMLYVKDCARAIGLLQTVRNLDHVIYNVGSGRATSNGEVADAIKTAVPEARLELRPGRNPRGLGHDIWLDTGRLREDTGFEPDYDTVAAAADYVGWLRAGNDQ
jgi:UDP-glucose 4-epimerase